MKLPRPHLRWPRQRLPEDGSSEDPALDRLAALPAESVPEPEAAAAMPAEDARLLRRTRLKLMAWSGGVSLVILVGLGLAVYQLVSTTVVNGARDQLERVALRDTENTPDFVFPIQGEAAGLLPIRVSPAGSTQVPLGVTSIPNGLPDRASLDAVKQPGDIDMREITAPGGTPYRVISGYVDDPRFRGWKVQWIQNRTSEVGFLDTLRLILLGGGAVALLLSILFGYLYAGRALVPIRESITRRQAALQRQREFTANASHELRAPLTVIRASVEDLRRNRRKKVEEVGAALDDIDAEVGSVTALVEDMLFLARTDSGVVQLDRIPLDLSDEAAEATSLLAALGTERHVALRLDLLPAPVTGDPVRLRQLVTILVDNAIRHSPAGSTVEVRVGPDGGAALLEVVDNGQGVKPEDLPRLWERFWRADDAPAGGTGLGLAIARWIVEQHGGTIGAENRPEGGARFWARLPATPESEATATEPGPAGTAEAEPGKQPATPAS